MNLEVLEISRKYDGRNHLWSEMNVRTSIGRYIIHENLVDGNMVITIKQGKSQAVYNTMLDFYLDSGIEKDVFDRIYKAVKDIIENGWMRKKGGSKHGL